MNPELNPELNQGNVPPEVPRIVGYCRACGKALDQATMRSAQGTIFCADHVPAEAGGPAWTAPATSGPSPYSSATPYGTYAHPPALNPSVSPGLAFLLGLIPGVGAIYNGQYAKGLAHAAILGLLITIASNGGGEWVFGLLIAAFVIYMPFEAYHTAQKRRQGLAVDEFSGLSANTGRSSRFPVGPLVLIALGILFLLNNLELLNLRAMVRYWPVLLIGLGLYLLWERLLGGGDSDDASGTGGGHA